MASDMPAPVAYQDDGGTPLALLDNVKHCKMPVLKANVDRCQHGLIACSRMSNHHVAHDILMRCIARLECKQECALYNQRVGGWVALAHYEVVEHLFAGAWKADVASILRGRQLALP